MNSRMDLVKSDALRRLRPFLQREASPSRPKARVERDQAIRAYLAEIAQAQLVALMDRQALPLVEELKGWVDWMLNDGVENAGRHATVGAAAEQHRDALFDIVRSGYLAELDRRQRSWEAAGMGGVGMTPKMLAEEAEARRELEEAFLRRQQEQEARKQPALEAPRPEPEARPLTRDKYFSIIFLSDERIQVKRRDQFETLNYAEFGFQDNSRNYG